jgi:hypothetical protein
MKIIQEVAGQVYIGVFTSLSYLTSIPLMTISLQPDLERWWRSSTLSATLWSAIPWFKQQFKPNLIVCCKAVSLSTVIFKNFITFKPPSLRHIGGYLFCLLVSFFSLMFLSLPLWDGRWNSMLTVESFPGVSHYVAEDDVYKGYHIPANSLVIANQK